MIEQYFKAIWIILPITVVTVLLEGVRTIWTPKTGKASTGGTLFGILIFSLGFGCLAILVLNWINATWPGTATQIYFWLAVGCAAVLTLLAVIMPLVFKVRWADAAVWTMLNFLWGLGYGWYLPQILNSSVGGV